MTVTNLKKAIAQYLGKAVADFAISGGPDLLILALNNARLKAEQLHDLNSSQVFVDLVVDEVAGAALSAAKLHGTNTAVSIRSIESIGKFTVDGIFYPVDWVTSKQLRNKEKKVYDSQDDFDPDIRYPSDAEFESRLVRNSGIAIFGETLYIRPVGVAGTTQTIGIEGTRWLADYADGTADNADAFLAHGYNYLMWQGMCEANYLFKTFAPREEGNLTPPTKEAAEALETFLRWDDFQYSGTSQ